MPPVIERHIYPTAGAAADRCVWLRFRRFLCVPSAPALVSFTTYVFAAPDPVQTMPPELWNKWVARSV
jgi:hypothetical protein